VNILFKKCDFCLKASYCITYLDFILIDVGIPITGDLRNSQK